MMGKIKLSIVVPAYNEEKVISNTLDILTRFFGNKNIKYEIIIVDDGSTDNTKDIVEKYSYRCPKIKLISNKENKGKGYAVKAGVLSANGDIIFVTDSDLSGDLNCYNLLEEFLYGGFDIVIGSRYLANSKVINRPFMRNMAGKIFNKILKIFKLTYFQDTQCGFKLFKCQVAKDLFQSLNILGYSYEVEILYRAIKKGYKVKEVPIIWAEKGLSNISLIKDSFIMMREILKILKIRKNLC